MKKIRYIAMLTAACLAMMSTLPMPTVTANAYEAGDFITADGMRFQVLSVDEDGTLNVSLSSGGNAKTTTTFAFPENYSYEGVPVRLVELSSFGFRNFGALTTVTLPDTVEKIEGSAFNGCSSLTSVNIPASVKSIGYNAFGNTQILENIPGDCKYYQDWLIGISNESELETLEVQEGTVGIANFAGSDTNLTSVKLPSTLKYLSDWVFMPTKITEIELPEGLLYIGEYAFFGRALTKVTIPSTVQEIGERAFDSTKLTEVTISEGVQEIRECAFSNTNLKEVTIPASVQKIGNGAFCFYPDTTDSSLKFTVLNPDCEIYDSSSTLGGGGSVTIAGYEGSTAQAYAEKYEGVYKKTFVSLGAAPETTTVTTTTTTATTTTTTETTTTTTETTTTTTETTTTTTTTAPEPESEPGDLDGDGKITVADAQYALQAAVNLLGNNDPGLSPAQLTAADIDGDGRVTVADAQMILTYYVDVTLGGLSTTWDDIRDANT